MAYFPVKVFAPASVGNVAVGFDSLGLCLDKPGDELILKPGKKKGLHITKITGDRKKLPHDVLKNTAGYAAYKVLEAVGETDLPIELELFKKMPFGSGLGSSAASAVAGAFAMNYYLKQPFEKRELLRFALDGEELASGARHADNVAPSMLGGVILIRDNATLDIIRVHCPKGLKVCVIHPKIEILTAESRGILSDTVPLKNFITQSANLASFVAGMFNSDIEMIRRSLEDVVIEPQRKHLIPHFDKMKEIAMEENALGFSISGAGPAVFALCANTLIAENIGYRIGKLLKDNKMNHTIYQSGINQEGVVLY